MGQDTPDLQTLIDRLEKIERKVGVDTPWSQIVEAGAFILLDGNGKRRAELSGLPLGDYGLSMFDKNEKKVAELIIMMGQSILHLCDTNEIPRLSLAVSSAGPYIGLRDVTGETRLMLSVSADNPGFMLLDRNEKARIMMTVADDGPNLTFFEPDGETPVYSIP